MSEPTLIVVPVKTLDRAKSRLGPILSSTDRQGLMLAMLRDVTTKIEDTTPETPLLLLSRDGKVRDYAYDRGYGYLEETHSGLNGSIGDATVWAIEKGYHRMLVIHSDVPLLTGRDVEQLIFPKKGSHVILAPSKDGGTNALLRQPPEIIPTSFGRNSYLNHMKLAKKKGCLLEVYRSPTVEFDIDTLKDLVEFISRKSDTYTSQFISQKILIK